MAFILEKVVPWGRSLDEYRRMFALTDPIGADGLLVGTTTSAGELVAGWAKGASVYFR